MKAVVFAYSNVGDRCVRVLHAAGVDIALVVTHRDHPGEKLWFSRVADTAAELGLQTLFTEDSSAEALGEAVRRAAPDLIFSFYYRAMLPMAWLERAPFGAFNMHGSLLPAFRGRAPTNWAVLKGATQTGATLHRMAAKPDAGPIVDQCAVPILPDDTGEQVFDKVCVAAEIVLWRSLPAILAGQAPSLPNEITRGSYFGGRKPDDGRIDWSKSAQSVYNLIRAVAPPYPGAFTELGARRLVIARARLAGPAHPNLREAPLGSPRSEPAHVVSGAAGDHGMPARLALGLGVRDGQMVGVCADGGTILIQELWCEGQPVSATELASWLSVEAAH